MRRERNLTHARHVVLARGVVKVCAALGATTAVNPGAKSPAGPADLVVGCYPRADALVAAQCVMHPLE